MQVIGLTSFGVLYLGRQLQDGSTVAIKEYMPSSLATRTRDGRVEVTDPAHVPAFERGLQAFLAEALTLGPCTVVLGACESGLGEVGVGDETVGLVRAFLVAGAARVLASLWPVDDAVTADFMAGFYGALAAGQPPALALRSAQERVILTHPHPHFWGAFALYGGF